MGRRRKFLSVGGFEHAKKQCDSRLVINSTNRTATCAAKSTAGPVRGSPSRWRTTRPHPRNSIAWELDPNDRQSTCMALAKLAGAGVRLRYRGRYNETDVFAEATTFVDLLPSHGQIFNLLCVYVDVES